MKRTLSPALLIMLSIIGILMLLSCESKSHSAYQSMKLTEKVVIIEALPTVTTVDGIATTYKVNRPYKGVVDWIRVVNTPRYNIGDTILYKF